MREKLAALCHTQWSGWMSYLFSKGVFNEDGAWTMPKEFVDRWKRQLSTSYEDLSHSEKESDRKEADKFLAIIENIGMVRISHEYRPGEYCADICCDQYNDGKFSDVCNDCREFIYYQWLKKYGYRLLKLI